MIGYYDYTVVLTYLSLLSASFGIMISLSGHGHPYIGGFFLLFCGLCDAFDGKVARIKKDRSQEERNFGIQIDSLSDLVAFGVLPACIGSALLRVSPLMALLEERYSLALRQGATVFLTALLVLYILAALIRLAYFNITEEKRQAEEEGVRTYFTGLPVTSAALILPLVLFLNYVIPGEVTLLYFVSTACMGIAFLGKFRLRKPGMRGVLVLIGIGTVEFLLLLLGKWMK